MENKKVIYLNIMPRTRTPHPNYSLAIVLAIAAAIMSIIAIAQVRNVFSPPAPSLKRPVLSRLRSTYPAGWPRSRRVRLSTPR